jgi:eukaryotic-like serine/threonine-protein kinase
LTQSGLLVGSPGFISPEQAEGGEVGPPADVFSLGALLAFAATGEGPFGTGSTLALVYRVIHCQPDLDRVPAELRALVRLCLAKDPAARPTARELLAETDATRSLSPSSVPSSAPSSVPLPPPVSVSTLDLTAPDLPLSLAPAQPTPSGPVPGGHENARRGEWHRRRRGWRPLVATAIVAGLAGAAATAGITLTSAQRPSHAAQSEGRAASAQTTPPVTFAPPPPRSRAPAPSSTPTPTYGGY